MKFNVFLLHAFFMLPMLLLAHPPARIINKFYANAGLSSISTYSINKLLISHEITKKAYGISKNHDIIEQFSN